MKTSHRIFLSIASGAGLLALALATPAQAQDVYWSIGLSSPGIQVGVSSAPQVLVTPRPVVYVRPAPMVYAQPVPVVYARPGPVVVLPAPVIRTEWRHPGRHHGWQHRYDGREVPRQQYEIERHGYAQPERRG